MMGIFILHIIHKCVSVHVSLTGSVGSDEQVIIRSVALLNFTNMPSNGRDGPCRVTTGLNTGEQEVKNLRHFLFFPAVDLYDCNKWGFFYDRLTDDVS